MREWHYETSLDLEQPLIERLRRFPREPDMLVYGLRCLTSLLMRAWLRAYHRLQLVGRNNLPREGSFVMVANHGSHLDALCLLAALPFRRLHRAFPAAASDYFFVGLPRMFLAAAVVNVLPFDRTIHIRQSLSLCQQLLANPGNILILFPEGTRTMTGRIGGFKPGIGALLAGTTIPAVPCRLAGAAGAWPKGRLLPRPRRVRLTIGLPRTFADRTPGRATAQHIADELRQAVIALGTSDAG